MSPPELVLGEELPELHYEGWSDWFVKTYDIQQLWQLQPTYMLVQIAFLAGATINLIHALVNGGRLPYLWLATLLHGIVVEITTYVLPDIDNFWHSQTPIIFLGRRLPLHIMALYPVFIYHASIAASRLQIHKWAEPFAVGLLVVLVDIPYDIVSVKFMHWTWHDTDPNIGDRHYWVPWNSYYFHTTFAASLTFWFTVGRDDKWKKESVGKEILNVILAALLGMPGGVLLFLPLYHPLHDFKGIHSEVTYFMLFTIFLLIIWSADRANKFSSSKVVRKDVGRSCTIPMALHLLAHYGLFFGMTIFGYPENEVSIGLHEKIGPCNVTIPIHTAFGSVLQKQKYLCTENYDEAYFDFHCVPGNRLPAHGSSWYTACGTPFQNRAEYIAVIGTICLLAAGVFWNLHFRFAEHKTKKSEKKKKA